MQKSRYAVFFEDSRPKKWAMRCDVRILFFWVPCWTDFHDTEAEAIKQRDFHAAREINKRAPLGIRSSHWKP